MRNMSDAVHLDPASTTKGSSRVLADLRDQIRGLETSRRRKRPVLPFGLPGIDRSLPDGGLVLGALHEIAGGGAQAVNGVAAALFAAGILARLKGPVLWVLRGRDLFAPALAGVGLHPDRVIYVEAGIEQSVLICMEEGLRYRGLAGVVGELARLPLTESRRLQLAASESGVVCLAIRRWRNQQAAVDFGQPTASMSRWRITPVPSAPLPVPGIGRPRWRVELMRHRGGEGKDWILEACDAEGRLGLAADLAHGSSAPDLPSRVAS